MTYLNKLSTILLAGVVFFAAFNWLTMPDGNPISDAAYGANSLEEVLLKSFSTANPALLSDYLENSVSLNIVDDHQLVQAPMVINLLDDFFLENPPRRVAYIHEGASRTKQGSFLILNLQTKFQKQFRCFVYQKNNKIVEINIELDSNLI